MRAFADINLSGRLLVLLMVCLVIAGPKGVFAAVRLAGPEVVKLSWSARALNVCDLNDDGRLDLVVTDNDRARIDLMYQRKPGENTSPARAVESGRWNPVLDDAPFRIESITTGAHTFDLEVGDLDGDGRADLVYTGRPDGLTIRYQDHEGSFERVRTIDLQSPSTWIETIAIADVNADDRLDLVVLGASSLQTYVQDAEGELIEVDAFPLTGDERYGLRVADLNEDRIADLMYQVSGSDRSVRVRLGLGGGAFGAEHSVRLSTRRGRMQPLNDNGTLQLVSIDHQTGAIETVDLQVRAATEVAFDDLQPRVIAAKRVGEGGKSLFAVGDFDGNGFVDIAVADAGSASIALLLQGKQRQFVRSPDFPCLAEVRGLAAGDLDGDDRDDLVLVSPAERAVAWMQLDSNGRLEYPKPLPLGEGKPLNVAVGELDGEVVVAYTLENGSDRSVVILRKGEDAAWAPQSIMLDKLRVPPRGLKMVDADQDGRLDLIVFAAHEPVRILLNRADGGFEPASQATGFQQGLLDDIDPSAFTTGDVDGDGRAEMLLASKSFARALRITGDGSLEVVDQFNKQACEGELEAAVIWRPTGDATPEVALIGAGASCLERLTKRRDGVFRSAGRLDLDTLEFQRAEVVPLGRDSQRDIFLFGEDRLMWVTTAGSDVVAETTVIHETDPLEISHSLLLTGDLDGDGVREIVAVDAGDSRTLEVLKLSEKAWASVMQFKVFESDPHYEGQTGAKYEPREGLIADVTNDGLDDLVLLVHDRLLVYPQVGVSR